MHKAIPVQFCDIFATSNSLQCLVYNPIYWVIM